MILSSKQLAELIQLTAEKGNVRIAEGTYGKHKTYMKRLDANGFGTGKQDIILASDNPVVGVSNFDNGNRLNSGRDFILTHMRILADTTAATTVLGSTYGKTNLPAALANGEIYIRQNGDDKLSTQIADFALTLDQVKYGNTFVELAQPIYLSAEQVIELQVAAAAAISAVACVSFELHGVEIVEK